VTNEPQFRDYDIYDEVDSTHMWLRVFSPQCAWFMIDDGMHDGRVFFDRKMMLKLRQALDKALKTKKPKETKR